MRVHGAFSVTLYAAVYTTMENITKHFTIKTYMYMYLYLNYF